MSQPAPFVVQVTGEVAPDGSAIGLAVERTEQGKADLCLRVEDLQFFVCLLLFLGCEAEKLRPSAIDARNPGIPLPISAINIGRGDDEQIYLMLEIGAASLTFGLPPADLKEIAETLLALSARHDVPGN